MADYVTFNGSTHGIRLAVGPTDMFFPTATVAVSVTVRFRTSSTAARGIIWHDLGNGSREYYIDVNASGAGTGGVRFVGFNGGAIFFVPNAGVNVCDGAWHTVTGVRVSATSHRWFLDGSQVGSDRTENIGTSASIDSRNAGCVQNQTVRYNGDLAYICLHQKEVTAAENLAMHNGQSPLLAVTGVLTNFYPGGPASTSGDGHDALSNQFGVATANHVPSALATFPTLNSDGGPGFIDAATIDTVRAVLRTARLVQPGTGTDTDVLIREIGNIYQADDGDYVLHYTGRPSAGATSQIHYATSSDGVTWTKHGVLIDEATHGIYTEDSYVYEDAGTWWLMCENKTSLDVHQGIAVFSSADGKTGWTLEDADILPNGGGGTFDVNDVSSPVFWKEGATWYMLYEGRSSGDNGRIGLATASAPDGTWTKSGSNPVLSYSGSAGSWYERGIVPDDILKVGSTYYLTVHADGTLQGSAGYRNGIFESTDLTTWAEPSGHCNPLTGIICNTLMLSAVNGGHLIGVDESGTNSQAIMQYEMYKARIPTGNRRRRLLLCGAR